MAYQMTVAVYKRDKEYSKILSDLAELSTATILLS